MEVKPWIELKDIRFGDTILLPREPDPVTGERRSEKLTVGYVCVDALMSPPGEGKKLSEKEHIERFQLASKILESEKALQPLDLSAAERAQIMALVAGKWASMVVGQMALYLNDPVIASPANVTPLKAS